MIDRAYPFPEAARWPSDPAFGPASGERRLPRGRIVLDSPVPRLLAERPAVVLERFADGGDSWFRCAGLGQLPAITAQLRPGSLVSFYFDDRIARRRFSSPVRDLMLDLVAVHGPTGNAVVGRHPVDDLRITTVLPRDTVALDAFAQSLVPTSQALAPQSWVYFGIYPEPDDDGRTAVTLELPAWDADLGVRPA